MALLVGVAVAGGLITGCESKSSDPLQVAAKLEAALPAKAPEAATPVGEVLPSPAATAIAVDQKHQILAVASATSLALSPLADPVSGARQVPLPGPVGELTVIGDELLATVPSANAVLHIDPVSGTVRTEQVSGEPTGVSSRDGREFVALAKPGGVTIRRGDQQERLVADFPGAARTFPVNGRLLVLDRLYTTVTEMDPGDGGKGAALRAGEGASNGLVDRYGRVWVVDTRGNELIAFSVNPLIMRQRFPVAGTPYGIAYDAQRDLVWVTLTGRNEVVGFDIAGGEPVERHRISSVRQPDSVAVDSGTGRVFVASALDQGVQVVRP
ncbi:hypothetical protein D5S17_22660 [Pseudonocardiaceae bacterium YIM PH 21723]|nr:hypothetical protein D5S17_22660 [Pseudonocardiaceae bacterium YIM PH 21723]